MSIEYDPVKWPFNDEIIGHIPDNQGYSNSTHIIAEIPGLYYSHFLWHSHKTIYKDTLEACLDFCVMHGLLCDFVIQWWEP